MMSKKTYEAIAWAIHENWIPSCGNCGADSMFDFLLGDLCAIFAADNPRFNAARFRHACETAEGIRKSIKGE